MKAAWFAAALSAALLPGVSAHAQNAGVFGKWLSQEAPECVPVSTFGSVSTVTDLTPEQFQFVRAFYVALPPVSRTLPPAHNSKSGKSVRRRTGSAVAKVIAGLYENVAYSS